MYALKSVNAHEPPGPLEQPGSGSGAALTSARTKVVEDALAPRAVALHSRRSSAMLARKGRMKDVRHARS